MRKHTVDAFVYGAAAYAEMNLRALTARPVQGSHRFMRDREPQLYQPPEIPAADPDAGFSARVDRAIEELAAAVAGARKNGRGITGEQHTRILHIPDHD